MRNPGRQLFLTVILTAWGAASGFGQISLVGQLKPSLTTSYGDVWGEGNYAYLGTRGVEGVFIIDISDPSHPTLASTYLPSNGRRPQDVKTRNGIGYFAMDIDGGVDVVDLSDPTQPTFLANIPIGDTHNVFVHENLLFTTSARSPVLQVFDVSDPANPEYWYTVRGGNTLHDMTVIGNRLYTSSFAEGTRIFDISNISATSPPVELGLVLTGSSSHSSWATANNNILVSARERSNGEIAFFDVSDAADPQLLSLVFDNDFGADAFSPHNPIIIGQTAYVSWYEAGLQVFDLSDPVNPVHLGRYDTTDNWGVYPFLGNDRVLLSDISDGLIIVDVTGVLPPLVGDFNQDGALNVADIDALVAELAVDSMDLSFDLTNDGQLNGDDLAEWLAVAGAATFGPGSAYLFGDANLDGSVDGLDLIAWNRHKFEPIAAWSAGDFTADGFVDGQDFIRWNANKFTAAAVSVVPEPAWGALAWSWAGLLALWPRRAKRASVATSSPFFVT